MLRSTVAASATGGLSQCVRVLCRSLLFEPAHMSSAGATLNLGRPVLARLRLARLIGDESALRAVWLTKGASGTRPCMFCANVVALSAGLADDGLGLVDVTCSDPSRFVQVADADMWEQFDALEEANRTKTRKEFSILQQAAGLSYHEGSILNDAELRIHMPPISMTHMDWMHNFLVGGVLNTELTAFLSRAKEVLNIRYESLRQFVVADWRWPAAQQTHGVRCVSFTPGVAMASSSL